MSDKPRPWDTLDIVTAVVVGTVAVVAGLLGLAMGVSGGGGSVTGRLLIGLLQGAGSAALFGLLALLVVTLATAGWGLLRALWRRIRG